MFQTFTQLLFRSRVFQIVFVLFFVFGGEVRAQFPYGDSFRNPKSPGMIFGGSIDGNPATVRAFLTANQDSVTAYGSIGGGEQFAVADAPGSGYLRLTKAIKNARGFARNTRRFTASEGLDISFEYYTYGGTSQGTGAETNAGADGITFFLFDSDVIHLSAAPLEGYPLKGFYQGGYGGSLGYAQNTQQNAAGLRKGYLAIGLDEFGKFRMIQQGRQGGDPITSEVPEIPSSITLRGDGNGNATVPTNYEHLISIQTTNQIAMDNAPKGSAGAAFNLGGGAGFGGFGTVIPNRAAGLTQSQSGYRKARIVLTPNGNTGFIINVYITANVGGVLSTRRVVNDYNYVSTSAPPSNLSYGFISSTGDKTNVHEIRAITAVATVPKPPSLKDTLISRTVNKPIIFTEADFYRGDIDGYDISRFADPNGDALVQIQIKKVPEFGVLQLNGAAVILDQVILRANLKDLVYLPNTGYAGNDSFQWNGSDGTSYANYLIGTDGNPDPTKPAPATVRITMVPFSVGPNPALCIGGTSAPLTFSNNGAAKATEYSVTFDAAAKLVNFADIPFSTNNLTNLGNGPISITVPASAPAGEYNATLRVRNSGINFISDPISIKVIINALPTVAPITGMTDGRLCIGNTKALANTTTGGVWSSSNTTVATVNASGLVTGVSAGAATITYTVTNATTGCSNAVTTTFQVNTLPTVSAITGMGDGKLCVGNTRALASTTTGGVWSSSNTAVASVNTSGLVMSVSAGTATITYTVTDASTGCSHAVTATVQITALPTVTAITGMGDGKLCVANTKALASTTTGGVWSSSNTAVATVNTSGLVTGVSAGNVTITYTVTDATTGCSNAVTTTFQVNNLPTVAAITGMGDGKLCIGNTKALASTTTGGVWSSSNTAVATVNSIGLVTGVSAGTATITYTVTDATSGCSNAVTTTFQVNNIPTVAAITGMGDGKLCIGNTKALASTTTGGVWSSSNTAVATVNASGLVTGVSAGNVTITYTVTDATTGCSNAVTTTIQVNALPTVTAINGMGDGKLCLGNTKALASTTTGGVWSSSNTAVATVNASGLVTGVSAGNVTITYTVTDATTGCSNAVTTTIQVNALPTVTVITGMGDGKLCVGNTKTLASTTTGGVWSSSNTAVATVNTSGLLTGVSAGTVTITYTVTDASTGCSNAVTTTIQVNALPVVAPVSGPSSTIVGGNVQLTNSTSGGVWLSSNTSIATISSNGHIVALNPGVVTITYTVNSNGCESKVDHPFTVTNNTNTPPVAVADSYSVFKGGTISVSAPGLLLNDTDADNNTLTAVKVTDPTHGSLTTFSSTGSFTYKHSGDAATSDSFTYKVNDGTVDGNTVTVTIAISATNTPPSAVNDSYSVLRGGTLAISAPGILANDTDPDGNTLNALKVSNPTNGTLTLNTNGSFTYIHNGSATTSDSFSYKVTDGASESSSATVNITVTASNTAPVAVADTYNLQKGATLNVSAPGLLLNDSDAEGQTLKAIKVSDPANGTLTLNQNGSFTYIHNNGSSTSDSFTYKVNDGIIDGNTVTVTLNISASGNNAPVAVADTYSVIKGGTLNLTAPGVLSNDSDPDGNTLSAIKVSNPSNGTLTLNSNGSLTYVHNGGNSTSDSFGYKVNDGTVDGNITTVTINILPVNTPPVAVADSYTAVRGTTLNVAAPGLLTNDTDPEGNSLTAIKVSNPSFGTLTLNPNGSFSYVNNGNASGSDSFAYKVNDGTQDGNTVTVSISITSANALPVIGDISKSGSRDQVVVFTSADFTSKYSDADGDALNRIRILTLPANGTLKLNGSNITANQEILSSDLSGLTFTPTAGFVGGPISFNWNANDGKDYAASPRSVNITIIQVNASPQSLGDTYTVNKNATLTIAAPGVLTNDTDAESNALTAIKVSDPLHGTLTFNPNGSFTYKHNGGSETSDSFSYKANDGNSDGNTVLVNITITQVNTPPVVNGKEVSKIGTGFLPITFTADDFRASFVDAEGDGLVRIRLVTVPPASQGLLKLNGVTVSAGQEIAVADLGGLSFEPALNWGGTTNFTWNGSDGTTYATTNGNISVTVVRPTDPNAKIGLAKNLASVVPGLNGTYDVKFTFTVVNYGMYALENVSVRDNLTLAFGASTVTVKSISAFGNLKANTAFTGASDTELLLSTSRLEAGEEGVIELLINLKLPAAGGLFYNSATAEAQSVINGFRVSDVSTNGLKPDPNQAGDVSPSESTPIELESQPSFVPGGFSPNGDGNNDKFIIQNTNGKQVSLEVFNRWGNRVYKSTDYKNDWGGEVSEGFFVGRDIPDGTYYYIIIIDNTDKYVGFITVNR